MTLLHWIIHAYGIDSGGASLHLKLGIMNPWFIVEEKLRQMINSPSPILIKMMAEETYQHSSHSKINPAGFFQTAHACIHQRKAGLSIFPGIDIVLVANMNQGFITDIYTARFIVTFYLEFLYEVVAPFESSQESVYPAFLFASRRMLHHEMYYLSHTHITPCDIRGDTTATDAALGGFRDMFVVMYTPRFSETL